MKGFFQLIKTTIIGGLLFLVPIIILVAVPGKAYELMIKLAKPLSAWIPLYSIGGEALANILDVPASNLSRQGVNGFLYYLSNELVVNKPSCRLRCKRSETRGIEGYTCNFWLIHQFVN